MEVILPVIILMMLGIVIVEVMQKSTAFSLLMLFLCTIAIALVLTINQEKEFMEFRDNTQMHSDYSSNTKYQHWLIDNPK